MRLLQRWLRRGKSPLAGVEKVIPRQRTAEEILKGFFDAHPVLYYDPEKWQADVGELQLQRTAWIPDSLFNTRLSVHVRARLLFLALAGDSELLSDVVWWPERFSRVVRGIEYKCLEPELCELAADFYCLIWGDEYRRRTGSPEPDYTYLEEPVRVLPYAQAETQRALCRVLYGPYSYYPWRFGMLMRVHSLSLNLKAEIDLKWYESVRAKRGDERKKAAQEYAGLYFSYLDAMRREKSHDLLSQRQFYIGQVDRAVELLSRIRAGDFNPICSNYLANFPKLLNTGNTNILPMRLALYRLIAVSGMTIFGWHCPDLYDKMLAECDPALKPKLEAQIAAGAAELARMQAR
ncbi:MAG: hypothetical protein WCT32_04975 [Patescibacteria group bacterium]